MNKLEELNNRSKQLIIEKEEHPSQKETEKHIKNVQNFGNILVKEIEKRLKEHDQSKLEDPEIKYFDDNAGKLKDLTYGSKEYKQELENLKPALNHHYKANRHHPEHYKDGIKEMTLIDLLEMIIDWKSATLRHKVGDIIESIKKNQKRFGYSDELKQIFLNIVKEFFGEKDKNGK